MARENFGHAAIAQQVMANLEVFDKNCRREVGFVFMALYLRYDRLILHLTYKNSNYFVDKSNV